MEKNNPKKLLIMCWDSKHFPGFGELKRADGFMENRFWVRIREAVTRTPLLCLRVFNSRLLLLLLISQKRNLKNRTMWWEKLFSKIIFVPLVEPCARVLVSCVSEALSGWAAVVQAARVHVWPAAPPCVPSLRLPVKADFPVHLHCSRSKEIISENFKDCKAFTSLILPKHVGEGSLLRKSFLTVTHPPVSQLHSCKCVITQIFLWTADCHYLTLFGFPGRYVVIKRNMSPGYKSALGLDSICWGEQCR